MDKKTIYFICTGNSCRSQMVKVGEKKYWVKIGMSILVLKHMVLILKQ